MARLKIDGYGQLELNNVAFRRDGRVEAQLPLSAEDFKDKPAENGMLLAVDRLAGEIKLPAEGGSELIALHYSAEHMYDERLAGLNNFKLEVGDFYPRLGYLANGDKFTTNTVSYSGTSAALVTALGALSTTALYGNPSEDGSILIGAATQGGGDLLKVIAKTTMPDGSLGVKFQVIGA